MLSVRESVLPESHVLLDGCLYNTFSDMQQMCMGWRQMTGGRDTEWLFGRAAGAYCPNADLGHADAQIHIGDIYYRGIYDRKFDPVRAWVWYSLAAQGGDAQAMEQLSRVTAELTPEQLAEARQQLAEWQPGKCEKDLVPQDKQQ
jgi:TPR repeat protein